MDTVRRRQQKTREIPDGWTPDKDVFEPLHKLKVVIQPRSKSGNPAGYSIKVYHDGKMVYKDHLFMLCNRDVWNAVDEMFGNGDGIFTD